MNKSRTSVSTFSIENAVRKSIQKMKPYSSARDEFKEFETSMVFLDANENPFSNGYNRYPDPQQKQVKTILAKKKNVNVNQVLLGNGSDEVLDLLFRAFCEPNQDNIITLPPTYGMYGVLADLNAIENREILLNDAFEPDIDEILNAVSANTKIIFLCSPNNPTGNSFSDESVLKMIRNFDGLVVIDEAYVDFSAKESWLSELDEFPNLVITQTFSKAYGLAGLRVGVLYASEEIISVLNKIKPPYNLNTASQEIVLKKLSQHTLAAQVKKIVSERENVINTLKPIHFVKQIFPSDANFILVKVDNAALRYNQLIEAGIVTRNRNHQPLCENCIRITIGTKEENNKLITTLKSL